MDSAERARLGALRDAMQHQLLRGVIPFWVEHAADPEAGGYRTNFDEQGNHLGTPEKYLNTQARLLWWFSRLKRAFPGTAIYGELAARGADFLYAHFWDERYGGWYWKVRSDGSSLDDAKITYGQSFAIYALSEHHCATGDTRALRFADHTFELLQTYAADTLYGGYHENLERDWVVAPQGMQGGDRKGLDTHMHLMEAFTTLTAASGAHIHRRKLFELLQLISMRMIDPETGSGLNQFDLAWRPLPAVSLNRTWNAERVGAQEKPFDTTSYGHNIELVWLLHRALRPPPATWRHIALCSSDCSTTACATALTGKSGAFTATGRAMAKQWS